jgi:hypothetical protein
MRDAADTDAPSPRTQTAIAQALTMRSMLHYEEARDAYGDPYRSVVGLAGMALVAATALTVAWLLLGMVLIGS